MSLATPILFFIALFTFLSDDATKPARRTVEYPWMSVEGWNQFHESFLKRAKSGPVDLLFLGDSITQGWAFDGAEVWKKHFEPLNAANFGIGGDMTQQVLWRITEGKELEGLSPKVCVLMIGTNNFGISKHEPKEVVAGVQEVVKTLREKLPHTKILLLGIFPRDEKPDTDLRKKILAVNEELAKMDGNNSVKYMDIGAKFMNEDKTLPKEIMPDFLHLSRKGYEIWAEAIKPTIEEMSK